MPPIILGSADTFLRECKDSSLIPMQGMIRQLLAHECNPLRLSVRVQRPRGLATPVLATDADAVWKGNAADAGPGAFAS